MKKLNYCKPETTVETLSTQPLLGDSLGEGINKEKEKDTSTSDPNRSREGMFHFFDDDNEEE